MKNIKNDIMHENANQMKFQIPKIRAYPPWEYYPLSFNQRAYWYLRHINPQLWQLFFSRRITGPLDTAMLEKALNYVTQRHASLRTRFKSIHGKCYQFIHQHLAIHIPIIDISHLHTKEKEAELQRLAIASESDTIIQLDELPLFKAVLVQCAIEEHIFFLTIPHIISDEWSIRILWTEMVQAYNAYANGRLPIIETAPFQYHDFILWELELRNTPFFKKCENYWRKKIKGNTQILALPTDFPSPEMGMRTYRTDRVIITLEGNQVSTLRAIAFKGKCTLSCLLMTAFKMLLSRYTGQTDITIGFPFAGRRYSPGLYKIIFPMASISPMRTDISGNPTFMQLMERVHLNLSEAYEHQLYPFELIVNRIRSNRHSDGSFIFRVMFNKFPGESQEQEMTGVNISPGPLGLGKMHFDLCVYMMDTTCGIRMDWSFSIDIFSRSTIQRMVEHYKQLLKSIITGPEKPISDLCYLTSKEYRYVAGKWNCPPETRGPKESQIIQPLQMMFEAQARQFPWRIALVFQAIHITYEELNRRSNYLAHVLQSEGVRAGDLVGLYHKRSEEIVISIIAILKAGGAYVPLNPELPDKRLSYIVKDTNVCFILVQNALSDNAKQFLPETGVQVIVFDSPASSRASEATAFLPHENLKSLVYVLYTSGSTGRPKAVAMQHEALCNLMQFNHPDVSTQENPNEIDATRSLQTADYAFDVSCQEIFQALGFGGTLVMVTSMQRQDPEALLNLMIKEKIDNVILPPILLQAVAEVGLSADIWPKRLQEIITSGEQLIITDTMRKWLLNVSKNWKYKRGAFCLHNQYGPTESHVVTIHSMHGSPALWPESPPIGSPIANVRVYLLDADLKPVSVGISAELYIAGPCLARGYLNQPEQTAHNFFQDPVTGVYGDYVYRTGDLGTYLPNGSIQFLGRKDRQVKIHGYRIEPGEIESFLLKYPGICRSFVTVHKFENGKQIIAYVVAKKNVPKQLLIEDEIRLFLAQYLPQYMIPSHVVFLDSMPLTPFGKVASKQLPLPKKRRQSGSKPQPPRNYIEKKLVPMFETLLYKSPIGIYENFFEMGGDSLKGLVLLSGILNTFGVKLTVPLLIRNSTIANLAEQIRKKLKGGEKVLEISKTKTPLLMCLQPGEGKQALFLVPGGWGGRGEMFVYALLGPYLTPERPFYQLIAQGMDGLGIPRRSVKKIASDFIEAVTSFQPEGPYYLAGECVGGVIAFEMAQQMAARGIKPAILIMMEALCPRRKRYRWFNVETTFYKNLKAEHFLLNNPAIMKKSKLSTLEERILYSQYVYLKSIYRYVPRSYNGSSVFMVSEETFQTDPFMGWKLLVDPEPEIIKIPGDHSSYLRQYRTELGQQLKRCLDKVEKGHCHESSDN